MFKKKLKEIRMQNGLTQKEVAEYLCISPQSISKWENGEATPSIEFLPKLSELFNCSIDDLFKESERVIYDFGDIEKFAEFNRVFMTDKEDPAYVDPIAYMAENHGWEDNCIRFFKILEGEKCFTARMLQNKLSCDSETAKMLCAALERLGFVSKVPDSKYYTANAEDMGEFVSMAKVAKIFAKMSEVKSKDALIHWIENEM